MAHPKTKKRKNESSDFKRVKAKVGKRALKPANETKTEAKFGTISVGHQNVSREGSNKTVDSKSWEESVGAKELLSSRGLSLDDIMASLRHPAAAVRISAARGLKDAVTRKLATPEVIRSHLAMLLPICAKCCVDEDSEVRRLALEIIKETIMKILSLQSEATLVPFMPLIMAHVTSALHSLDRKTQLDGTAMVEMMSSTIPSLVAPFAQDFIPAYSTLLGHRTPEVNQSDSKNVAAKKESKYQSSTKNSGSNETTTYKLLRSLFTLLKTRNVKHRSNTLFNTTESVTADLTIMTGGRDVNALFVPSSPPNSSALVPLHSLVRLGAYCRSTHTGTQLGTSLTRKTFQICETIAADLLGKLRDIFAEATQPDKEKQDLNEILLILRTVHLFFNSCNWDYLSPKTKGVESFASVWRQYTSLMMTQFPQSAGPFASDLISEVDLEICMTLLDAHLGGMDTDSNHMKQVIAYLFAEVDRSRPPPSSTTDDAKTQVDDLLFSALEKLLIISERQSCAESQGGDLYFRIVKAVASSFSSKKTTEAEPSSKFSMACSSLARRFVLLSRLLFAQCSWSLPNSDSDSLAALQRQILQALANFLGSWGSEYLFETDVVVTLLHSVARRLDATEESNLLEHFRASILPLFKLRKKQCSVFEEFPVELQKKTIGLVVVLQSPTQALLDCLAKISARCWIGSSNITVSPTIASQLLWSIHTIKRTVAMQSYLGFLTSGMGIAKKPFGKLQAVAGAESTGIQSENILRFDPCVELVGFILCQSELAKVLPLLHPLFESWLKVEPQDCSPIPEKILFARSTFFILARCLSSFEGCGVRLRDIAPNLDKSSLASTCFLLKHLPCPRSGGTRSVVGDAELEAYLEPLALLFEKEGQLFRRCFSELASQVDSLPTTQQTNVVLSLNALTGNVRLAGVLQCSSGLLQYCKTIETKLSSGNLERAAGILRSSVEVRCSATDNAGQ